MIEGGSIVLTRGKVAIAAVSLIATGGLVAGAQAGARPTGGVVHVHEYDPPTNHPGTIFLTGAISDHGLDLAGAAGPHHTYNKLMLTKGSFEVNVGKIKSHQHLDNESCTLLVQGSGRVPIVKGSGTGAYRGITGTTHAKTGFVGAFPKKPNGRCNTDAPPKSGFGWASAVGRISLK
jgi:hypothetical protein